MIETNLIPMPKIRMNLTFKSFAQAVMIFYAFVFFISSYFVVEGSLAFQHLFAGLFTLGFAVIIQTKPIFYLEEESYICNDEAELELVEEEESKTL